MLLEYNINMNPKDIYCRMGVCIYRIFFFLMLAEEHILVMTLAYM